MATALLVAYGAYSLGTFTTSPALGEVVGNEHGISRGQGIDSCAAEEKPASAWYEAYTERTDLSFIGAYLGGITAKVEGCKVEPRAWWSEVHRAHPGPRSVGWDFLPIWDGKQAPCGPFKEGTTFSDTLTAGEGYAQARKEAGKEADEAIAAGEARGFTSRPGSIIYYDLEAFQEGALNDPNCLPAAKAYINAWDARISTYGTAAGLYGSSLGTEIKVFWNLEHKPNDAWIAEYGVPKSVYGINTKNVPKTYWEERRFHQFYTTGEEEKYIGNVRLKYDSDCALGIVAGYAEQRPIPECQS
jgi:hypothetical protein